MIALIIIDGKKRHYLAVKSLFALLKGITSKHKGDFYCLSCLHSYRPKNTHCSFTHCSFDNAKNRLDYYRGQDCMKKFCKDLNEHATKIINYKEKEMIPLTY